jgi:hypothetical protein
VVIIPLPLRLPDACNRIIASLACPPRCLPEPGQPTSAAPWGGVLPSALQRWRVGPSSQGGLGQRRTSTGAELRRLSSDLLAWCSWPASPLPTPFFSKPYLSAALPCPCHFPDRRLTVASGCPGCLQEKSQAPLPSPLPWPLLARALSGLVLSVWAGSSLRLRIQAWG